MLHFTWLFYVDVVFESSLKIAFSLEKNAFLKNQNLDNCSDHFQKTKICSNM